MIEITKDILKEIYKERSSNVKKYDFGLVVIIGGSDFYSGPPAFSALAAYRSGADVVRVIAPERAADIIASFSPSLATYSLEGKWLEKKHLSILAAQMQSAKIVANGNAAMVIGGGLGRSKPTQEAISEFLSQCDCRAVIDADAIYAVGKKPEVISGKNFIITPHAYEFFILTGKEVSHLAEEKKIEMVRQEAERLQTTILLKGSTDIISNGKEVALGHTGNPYMTKGGTGDTLAGICGALLARNIDPFSSAQAAAYINGKAGELASEKLKEGLLAMDLIEAIPSVLH